MKMLIILALFKASLSWADEPVLSAQQIADISNRFVTTVKETQIDQQMLSVPEFNKCVEENKITEADIKAGRSQDKREKARLCFEGKFKNISPDKIQSLADELQLQQFHLVQGKSNQELMKYFSNRIESALYGSGTSAEALKAKDKKLVDQRTFFEIYQAQLGTNILLNLAEYCSQKFVPQFDNKEEWKDTADIAHSQNEKNDRLSRLLKHVNDHDPARKATDPPKDIYADLESRMKDAFPVDKAKTELSSFFNVCLDTIQPLCELHAYCGDKTSADDKKKMLDVSPYLKDEKCEDPKKGEAACAMHAALESKRTNLAIVQTQIEKMRQESAADPNKTGFWLSMSAPNDIYEKRGHSAQDSIQGLATLTSKDVGEAMDKDAKNAVAEIDKVEKEDCAKNPENKECDKFFYSNKEAANFQNASIRYDAATEMEKARISQLNAKPKELKEYLKQKGYQDLLDKADSDPAEVVAIAQKRFEAERESSYNQMADAFKTKQVSNNNSVQEVKKDFQSKSASFSQLLLFNNVVSSFLVIEHEKGNTTTNSRVLTQELASMEGSSGAGTNDALKYFQHLAETNGGSSSSDDNAFVDTRFIDTILNSDTKKPKEAEPQ